MSPRLRLWGAVLLTAAALCCSSWLAPRGAAHTHASNWAPSWPVPALRSLTAGALAHELARPFVPSLPLPMWRPRTAAATASAGPLLAARAAALTRVAVHTLLALVLGLAAALLPRLRPRHVRRRGHAAARVHGLVRRGYDTSDIARRSRLSRDAVRALLASVEQEHTASRG